jgi:hypothetical protein
MTAVNNYNETNFINSIMEEYDLNNMNTMNINFIDYCNGLFEKHITKLIIDNIINIDNIVSLYYTKKEIRTSKKLYNNNTYSYNLLVIALLPKFLNAIQNKNNNDFSDAETEIYYSDEDIYYSDDNNDD